MLAVRLRLGLVGIENWQSIVKQEYQEYPKERSRSDTGLTSITRFGDNYATFLKGIFCVWVVWRCTGDPTDVVKAPLGLHLLHLAIEPLIDIIFVYGLRGVSIKTWKKETTKTLLAGKS